MRPFLPLVFLAALCACAPPPPDAPAPEPPPRPAPLLSACFADRACKSPLVVAHRGEGGTTPENTVASIRELATLGADVVEIDVRETADGVAVLLHDGTLTRTTDQGTLFPDRAEVSALSLAELKSLTIDDPACAPATADADADRCRVPTLVEALAAARGACVLMLDFKSADAARVAQLLVDEDALDIAWAFDSNDATLDVFEAAGAVTMPRAEDAATTAELITRRAPFAVHIDPGYLAEASALAAATQTKTFVNTFTTVDFGLATGPLTGDEAIIADAKDQLFVALDEGVDLLQTNFAPDLRRFVDEWLLAHP